MTAFMWGIVVGIAGTALLSALVLWVLTEISCEPEPDANPQR
jgi:hypothetical protein